MSILRNKLAESSREFWIHVAAVAEQVRNGVMPGPPSLFRAPDEAPQGNQTKVLLKTQTMVVLVGIIYENGTPGIYDFCGDRYIQRDDWHGIAGWMPLPD